MDDRPEAKSAALAEPVGVHQAVFPMPGACPVCGDALAVVRLECGTCGTAVVGRFGGSRFARLSPDQVAFLEAFLRSRGNIRRVERELGISYPTVRSRLNALLGALGLAVGPDEEEEGHRRRRREVLDHLEAGKLSPEEATRLLRQTAR
jgi:hypothetical protein